MSRFHQLYSPRARATNIEIIRAVRGATDQQQFEAADARVAAEMHPSLLAELDWMEMCTPPEGRPQCAQFVDGLFMHHLPLILSQRKVELELDEREFALEVAENVDFYRFLLSQRADIRDHIGADLWQRIEQAAAGAEQWAPQVAERIQLDTSSLVEKTMAKVLDRRWLWLMVHTAMDNCLAAGLDHVSSRTRTKYFLRQIGGQFPAIAGEPLENKQALDAFVSELRGLADIADRCGVLRLSELARGLAERCTGLDLDQISTFAGERAGGFGACGSCAMMFGSTALVAFDQDCPVGLPTTDGLICLPVDFNLSLCPFCGEPQRAELPSLFFSEPHKEIVYNVPQAGHPTPEAAFEVHRDALVAMRTAYMSQCDETKAAGFEAASERRAADSAEFLIAAQIGAVPNTQECCLVRAPNGAGLLVDPGSGALIAMSRAEIHSHFRDMPEALAPSHPLGSGQGWSALQAIAVGNYDYACGALGALVQRQDHAGVVNRVLANACLSQGDRQGALRALGVSGD